MALIPDDDDEIPEKPMDPEDNMDTPPLEEAPGEEGNMPVEGAQEMPPIDTPAATGPQMMPNLAATLPIDYLNKVAARVLMDAEIDYKSTEGWRQMAEKHRKLYAGEANDTVPGQKNLTIVALPYVRRAVRMFHSKQFPQMFPAGSKEHFGISVGGTGLQEVADRCATYMNNYMLNSPEYIPSHDRGLKQTDLYGCIFEVWKVCYSEREDPRAKQEIFLPEDVWIQYKSKADRADLADVPRITCRIRYHQHELEQEEDNGYYVGITQPQRRPREGVTDEEGSQVYDIQLPIFGPDSYDESGAPKYMSAREYDVIDQRPLKETADRQMGQEHIEDIPDGERIILEQDRWLKLPNERRQTPVTVCIDKLTSRVLRLARREREDLKDKLRFMREQMEHEAATETANQIHQQSMQQWQFQNEDAAIMHSQGTMGPDGLMQLPAEPYQPTPQPLPPPAIPKPAPIKMVPWNRWTKYDCDINTDGALGEGIPHDVAGQNKAANQVSTRAINQMTVNMLPTGVMSRQAKFTRGETQLVLGEIIESPLSASQVGTQNAGIHFVQFPQVDPNWHKAVDMFDKNSQEVTAFDIAMGAPGMSGETATEAEMRHSNATDNISVIAQRYNRSRAVSIKNLAYILSVILPDEGATVYHDGQPIVVTRQDFEMILGEMEVVFTCDPNLESKVVKQKKAKQLFDTVTQAISGPIPALDPMLAVMMLRTATAMMLKASDAPKAWVDALMQAPMPPMMGPQQGEQNGQPGQGKGNGKPPSGPVGGNDGGVPENGPGPAVPPIAAPVAA